MHNYTFLASACIISAIISMVTTNHMAKPKASTWEVHFTFSGMNYRATRQKLITQKGRIISYNNSVYYRLFLSMIWCPQMIVWFLWMWHYRVELNNKKRNRLSPYHNSKTLKIIRKGYNCICCPSAVCFASKWLVSIWANVQFNQASSRVCASLYASCEVSSKGIISQTILICFEKLKINCMGNDVHETGALIEIGYTPILKE